MLVYSKSAATVNTVMLVKDSANTNHYSVELLSLIIIAHAELWVEVYNGKRRLIITCPKSKIGGSGTPLILLTWKKRIVTYSSLKMLGWPSSLVSVQACSSEHWARTTQEQDLTLSCTQTSNIVSQTYQMLLLGLAQWQTLMCTQPRGIDLGKNLFPALHFVMKFAFCNLLLSGT